MTKLSKIEELKEIVAQTEKELEDLGVNGKFTVEGSNLVCRIVAYELTIKELEEKNKSE